MKYTLLTAVASAALMASGVLTQAQENPRHDERPGAEKSEVRPMASPKAQQREAPRAAQVDQRQDDSAAPRAEPREAPRAAQMDQRNDQGAVPRRAAEPNQAQERKPVERAQNGAERPDQRSAERPEQRPRVGATDEQRTRTGATERRGEPRVVGRVQTSPENASRVTDILTRNAQSENVNIDINVGVRVPESVTVYPVPDDVLAFAPEYEGYDYFIDNGEVVFVAPDSHEIVAAIDYEGRAAAVDQGTNVDETPRVAGARPCPVEN